MESGLRGRRSGGLGLHRQSSGCKDGGGDSHELPNRRLQCNGVYKILLTKILSGYFFAGHRTSGGYPTPVYSVLLNIATTLELQKATHGAKLELLEATLVTLESYKRCCTVYESVDGKQRSAMEQAPYGKAQGLMADETHVMQPQRQQEKGSPTQGQQLAQVQQQLTQVQQQPGQPQQRSQVEQQQQEQRQQVDWDEVARRVPP